MRERFFSLCEALLFVSPEPLPDTVIRDLLIEEEPAVADVFDTLFDDFRQWITRREGGVMIVRVAGGWQMVTRPECADAVSRLKTRRQTARFSRAALEVLAIIAYRQPITTPEIETIRGVDSSGVLKNLLDKKLITILGRKKGPGNPLLYGTTDQFLIAFGLDSLETLPDLTEFEELIPRDGPSPGLPFGERSEAMENESEEKITDEDD
ncbi:MAG TPA: SMC-Scp complex subunit ScpB [bacterium]|nr:SMC-Scp complex subunit ScpB [bacterium]